MGYFKLADSSPYDDTAIKTDISALQTGKVDKADGMGLISDSEKQRLSAVTNYDDTEIKTSLSALQTGKVDKTSLSTVATTGSYNDLTDKPETSDYTVFMQDTQPLQDGLWIKGEEKDFRFTQCDLRVLDNPISLSDFPIITYNQYTSLILFNKCIYMFGGYANGAATAEIVKFDITTKTKEVLSATLPSATLDTVVAEANGYIYIFGGQEEYGSKYYKKSIFRFDPATESCIQLSVACPCAFSRGTAFSINNIIYILPGSIHTMYLPEYRRKILKFNPSSNTFEVIETSLPVYCEYYNKSCVVDGKGYVFFYDGNILEFNPETETSVKLNSVISAPRNPGIATVNGVIYIFGGRTPGENKSTDIYYFKPETDTLKKLSNVLPESGNITNAFTIGEDIYIFTSGITPMKMIPLVYGLFDGYYIKLSTSGKMTKISDNFIAQVESVHSGVNFDDKIESYSIFNDVATKIE